jgi:hypothetical protein
MVQERLLVTRLRTYEGKIMVPCFVGRVGHLFDIKQFQHNEKKIKRTGSINYITYSKCDIIFQ